MEPTTTESTPWGEHLPAASAEQLDAMYTVAHMLYERGDFARAADILRYVVLADPLRSDAWWALGACHEQVDDHAIAAALYDIGYRMGEDAALGLLCARAFVRAGEPARAREILATLLDNDPTPDTKVKAQSILHEMGAS